MIDELSIVIPCYNEEKVILNTLNKVSKYCKKHIKKYEIIVVDDGSTDKTQKIVEENFPKAFIWDNISNYGKGFSVKMGMFASELKWTLFMDADLSTPIEEIEKLFKYKDEYDVIFGSRNTIGSKRVVNQPFYRVWAGRAFPLLVNLLMGWKYGDTQCGFKLFHKDAKEKIFRGQQINGFAFDVEVLYIAKKKNIKCKEVGITWKNNPNSKVNIIKDSWKMFKEVLRIKKIYWWL